MYNTFGKINTKSKIILMASEEDSNSKKAPLTWKISNFGKTKSESITIK